MQTLFQNIASFSKFSAKFLLITAFIFSAVAILNAQTLDAFNPNANVAVDDIEPLSDGKIMICGQFTTIGGQNRRAIARLNADGTLDTTFPAIDPAFQNILDMIIQPDGKILISGGFSSINGVARIRVARLNTDGTLDTSFDAGLTTPVGVSRMALQPDGKVLIPANFSSGGFTSITVLRRNSNGSADASFASRAFNGQIAQLVLQPDGKVLAVGAFTTVDDLPHRNIVRLNADGSLDTSFNSSINNGAVFLMTLAPDGKIYAGGNFTTVGGQTRSYFARLNSNGSLDTSFQDPQAFAATSGAVRPSIVLPNGKILIAGSFDTVGGAARKQLARLNSDGSLDTTFRNMQVGVDGSSAPSMIKRQPDGKILIGGNFTTIDGQTRNRLARITTDDDIVPVISPYDFDGDGKSDLSVFRPAENNWYINRSSNNQFYGAQLGLSTDKLAPADFDGDGKSDIAVWRESEGRFYILQSSNNSVRVENFGLSGDVLTVGDYDGDGKADLSTYREGSQSYFFYRGSLNNPNNNITYLPWGTSGDKAVRGDFDGDGKLDAAVFRPSNNTWYIRQSADNQVVYRTLGLSTDKRVSGDFDGDGKTDICVFRDGVWYILQSSNNQITYRNWGTNTDTLVAGDYDGDGKTDVAVWRSGIYYILSSSNSAANYQYFGASGDQPIAAAFVQ